jgi:hypothetical protein
MKKMAPITIGLLLTLFCPLSGKSQIQPEIQGWNILSDSYEDALVTISAAQEYHINHLQLSGELVMNLSELKVPAKRDVVNQLISKGHAAGIKQVVLWDHAFYSLDYYPEQFKTGLQGTIDLDNPEFWTWFKQDYRNMMNLVPEADGLVLTFIETGARAENQFSEKLKTGAEKLAAVVDAVASVVCDEIGKQLYIRTFAYTGKEYQNTIGCIAHIRNNKIILMMKETPHDFFLTHPNDKYAGTIDRPTIIEFDTGNEFNGQGIIANTWPEYIVGRWCELIRRPHVIGYVARTDRYGDTRLVGTPNEILLYALKRYSEDQKVTVDEMYDEFITLKYGKEAIPVLKQAFKQAYGIVTSSLYTLGTNIANHSKMDYDPYKSSYGRHVSGKWIDPPVVYVGHGINREFHYWKDIIEHLAPARLKEPEAALKVEAPEVIRNHWVTPYEKMDETYLNYVITEKHYGSEMARKALSLVEKARPVLSDESYSLIYQMFYRTLLTARLYEAAATAYFGYRVYTRGKSFQTPYLTETLQHALDSLQVTAGEIEKYPGKVPVGQWNWRKDAGTAREYRRLILDTGWKEYGNVVFNPQK